MMLMIGVLIVWNTVIPAMVPQITEPTAVPADLLPAAVKLARRLQALPVGTIYAIMLVKETAREWKLVVLNEQGSKIETLR